MNNKMLYSLLLVACGAFVILYATQRRCRHVIPMSQVTTEQPQKAGIQSSPIIIDAQWAKITVKDNGKELVYEDVKLWPGRSRKWDWTESGTHHNPGIQIADIQEFINNVDAVILTRGMDLVLQVPQATIDYAKKLGKQVYVGQTQDMVKKYNELVKQGIKVGGVFHSTC